MTLTTAAGSLAAATTRLRRAGQVPAPVALPVALTGTRLATLAGSGGGAVEATVAAALDRLSASRGEAVQGAPDASPVAPSAPPRPYAVSLPPAPGAPSGTTTDLPSEALGVEHRHDARRLLTGPGRRATTRPSAASRQVETMPSAGDETDELSTTGTKGLAQQPLPPSVAPTTAAVPNGVHPAGAWRRAVTPVTVPSDASTADLLRSLVAQTTGGRSVSPASVVAPTRSPAASPSATPASGRSESVDGPASERPAPAAIAPTPMTSRPVAPSIPASAATPAPMTPGHVSSSATWGDAPAPVGLAGLVGWWQDHIEPDPGGHRGATAPDPRAGDTAYGPTGFEPWSTPGAGTAEQLRDALAQLLLEEALADGLEVTDGTAQA